MNYFYEKLKLMKTTYILGAGFSRAAGLPLMNDFYLTSKDIYPDLGSSVKSSFNRVFDFWNEYSNVKHYLDVDFFNIEELLSIIEMSHYLSQDNASKLKNDILIFIKEVIRRQTPLLKTTIELYEPYRIFLKNALGFRFDEIHDQYELTNENEASFISLNYDMLIENTIEIFNKENRKSRLVNPNLFIANYGEGIEYDGEVSFPEDSIKIDIAKLHGSLNFKDNLIIPPTWNKTSNEKIKGAWQLAHQLLTETNRIVFIGYSLPQTDSYIKYLLINAIKENENLKRIEVINPDDNQKSTQKRYYSFFDQNLEKKQMFEYIPMKFEDWVEKTFPKEETNGYLIDVSTL